MLSVAIPGEKGSYSELAAVRYFGKAERIYCETFSEAFSAVGKQADYGFVPIENSIEGVVTEVCDLLMNRNLHIIGEKILRIEHCLIANKGVSIKEIRTVYSHPQALAQSRKYLERLGAKIIPFPDTAGSVRMIKEKGFMDSAGVASQYAAKVYGMEVLRKNLETHEHNYTRFLVLSKKARNRRGRGAKTSLGLVTKNVPGALYKVLGCFYDNKVNLTYLQSRPVLGKPWEYGFYLECSGSVEERGLRGALRELRANTDKIRVLGSYMAADRSSVRRSP